MSEEEKQKREEKKVSEEKDKVVEKTEEAKKVVDEAPSKEEKTALTLKEAKGTNGRFKGRRRRKTQEELLEEHLSGWVPKTKLGLLVKKGEIKNLNEIIDKEMAILEPEVVDTLIRLENDLLFAGQSKGKFGGGKRRAWRQSQKKTKEGNVVTFSALAVVGNKDGYVGLGFGKAKETLPAREKALRKAKMNIIKVQRGSGSFDGSSNEPHSIPHTVEGKCGSVKIKLMPASQGTGLVIGDEGKKILRLAGIKDVYSQVKGQTRTTINYAKAIIDALGKLR
ncbi:MAG: 30S ribosomal protein S5 [Nanoarchaeota archaeon]|nr:30S ribosomal protein S5 [Nanoarchaeota archaeon]